MRIIYIIVLCGLLAYIFIRKRRIDCFTILSLSTFVYTYPTFFGYLLISRKRVNVVDCVYTCLTIFCAILFFFTVISDFININTACFDRKSEKNNVRSNYANLTISIIGILLMIYTVTLYGDINGSEKNVLLMSATKGTEYFKYFATFSFVYAFTNKGKYIMVSRVIAIVLVLYTVILGHRSFAVIGLLAIIYWKICLMTHGQKASLLHYLVKHKVITLFVLIFGMVVIFIKGVLAALLMGNYSLVIQRLTSPEYYINSLMTLESTSIMQNLQYACTDKIGTGLYDYIMSLFALVPFVGGRIIALLGIQSFDDLLNMKYNKLYSQGFGMGATFMGEAYTAGGYILLVLSTIGLFLIVWIMYKKLFYFRDPFAMTWLLIGIVYLTFYFYRNTLAFSLTTIRAYFYILILGIMFKNIPRIVVRKKRRNVIKINSISNRTK